jgi:hypothetical protein
MLTQIYISEHQDVKDSIITDKFNQINQILTPNEDTDQIPDSSSLLKILDTKIMDDAYYEMGEEPTLGAIALSTTEVQNQKITELLVKDKSELFSNLLYQELKDIYKNYIELAVEPPQSIITTQDQSIITTQSQSRITTQEQQQAMPITTQEQQQAMPITTQEQQQASFNAFNIDLSDIELLDLPLDDGSYFLFKDTSIIDTLRNEISHPQSDIESQINVLYDTFALRHKFIDYLITYRENTETEVYSYYKNFMTNLSSENTSFNITNKEFFNNMVD